MSEFDELSNRIDGLEKYFEAILTAAKMDAATNAKVSAQFNALRSIVEELAEHEGIPIPDLQRHYETRVRYFHALNLESIERISPRLATELDTRPIDDPGPDDEFPPLFPEKRE